MSLKKPSTRSANRADADLSIGGQVFLTRCPAELMKWRLPKKFLGLGENPGLEARPMEPRGEGQMGLVRLEGQEAGGVLDPDECCDEQKRGGRFC